MIQASWRGRMAASVAAAVLVAALFPAPAGGQATVLRGLVQDGSGKPLAKVRVVLLDPERGTGFETRTNKKGEFMQVGLPAAAYRATFELEGYVTQESVITIKIGMEERADIVLKKVPPRMEADPDFAGGLSLFQEGKYEDAVASFLKARERYPERVEPFYNLGVAYLRLGRTGEAAEALGTAVRLSPDAPEPYLALGEARALQGANDKALEAFVKAAALAPDSSAAHYNLGLAYYRADRTAEALASFEQVLRIDPKSAAAHYQAGLACVKTGDVPAAIRHFEAFLALEPDRSDAARVRAMIDELKKG